MIQADIDNMADVLDAAQHGGVVEFSPGVYHMGGVVLADGIDLTWTAPQGGVTIVHDDSLGSMVTGNPASWRIRGIDFDGRYRARPGRAPLLDLSVGTLKVAGCGFTGTAQAAIRLTNLDAFDVHECRFNDMAPGQMASGGNSQAILIQATRPGTVSIERCIFTAAPGRSIPPGGIAVSCDATMPVRVRECWFDSVGQAIGAPVHEYTGAVYLYRNCDGSVIEGNVFANCSFSCVSAQRSSRVRIRANDIMWSRGPESYAIRVGNRAPLTRVHSIWIEGNSIRDWDGEAIVAEFDPGWEVEGLHVRGNHVQDCGSGIRVKRARRCCEVTGNTIRRAMPAISQQSSESLVDGNCVDN